MEEGGREGRREENRVASTLLEAPMAMPRSGHQWACIITCPGHHKNDRDDEDEEDDEDDENDEDDSNL